MTYVIPDQKPPRPPNNPRMADFFERCRRDFNERREDTIVVLDRFIESYEKRVNDAERLNDLHLDAIKKRRDEFLNIKNLINEGKEEVAFTHFFRTFSTCLPHRRFEGLL